MKTSSRTAWTGRIRPIPDERGDADNHSVGAGSDLACTGSGDRVITCHGPCTADCPGSGECEVTCPDDLGAAQMCGDPIVCGPCP